MWLTVCLILFAVGFLIVISNGTSMTLDPHGGIAGFASSFQGALNQVISAVIASAITLYLGASALGLGLILVVVALICLAGLAHWQRQHNG